MKMDEKLTTRIRGSLMGIAALLIFWVALTGAFLNAETIYLKSGTVLEGTVKSAGSDFLQIETPDGTFAIKKTSIDRIDYNAAPAQPSEGEESARLQTKADRPRVKKIRALSMNPVSPFLMWDTKSGRRGLSVMSLEYETILKYGHGVALGLSSFEAEMSQGSINGALYRASYRFHPSLSLAGGYFAVGISMASAEAISLPSRRSKKDELTGIELGLGHQWISQGGWAASLGLHLFSFGSQVHDPDSGGVKFGGLFPWLHLGAGYSF